MSEKNVNITNIINSTVGAVATGDGAQANGAANLSSAADAARKIKQALEPLARRADGVNLSAYNMRWGEVVNVRFDVSRVVTLRLSLPETLASHPEVGHRLDELEEFAQEFNTHMEGVRLGGFNGQVFMAQVSTYALRINRAAEMVIRQIDEWMKQASTGG